MATKHQIAELVEKMTAERARLLAVLESMSEEELLAAPTDGEEWNAKQQMSHLCEMEAAYRAWVEHAVEEDGAIVDGVFGKPPTIRLEDADKHTGRDHLAEMRRQRSETMRLIGSLRPEDFERTATNRPFGTLTVMQWLRSYYRHDRMHVDQLSGRDPTYKPKFVSGSEPDQRRS
ncbi:MAG: DinB family protein [Dehalococcoidia bacterium]